VEVETQFCPVHLFFSYNIVYVFPVLQPAPNSLCSYGWHDYYSTVLVELAASKIATPPIYAAVFAGHARTLEVRDVATPPLLMFSLKKKLITTPKSRKRRPRTSSTFYLWIEII